MELYEELNALTAQVAGVDPDIPAAKAEVARLLEKLKQMNSENSIRCAELLRIAQDQLETGAINAARSSLGTASLVIRGGGPTRPGTL